MLWEICCAVEIRPAALSSCCVTTKPFFLPHELQGLLTWESPHFPQMSSACFCLGCRNSCFLFCVVPLKPISNRWACFHASEIQTEGSLFKRSQMSEVDTVPPLRVAPYAGKYFSLTAGLFEALAGMYSWTQWMRKWSFFFLETVYFSEKEAKKWNVSIQHTGRGGSHGARISSHLLSSCVCNVLL